MKNKTVFDVNIWISYFINDQTEEIASMILNHEVVLFRSDTMTKELESVLCRNKIRKYLTAPIEDYMDVYESLSLYYHTIQSFTGCSDPKDNYLFDLAYQTTSDYLVSGDKKVLSVSVDEPLKVLSLSLYKQTISKRP